VRSLLSGITEGDRLVHVLKKLNSLPKDLEKYFKHVLETDIDLESNKEDTSHMFLVTLIANDTLPLTSYWFIDQQGPEIVAEQKIQPWNLQMVKRRLKNAEKRVYACCKGLLEVQFFESEINDDVTLNSSVLFNYKVDFLHRTVRDFLKGSEVMTMLKEWSGTDFDANIAICKAIISQIKTAPQEKAYFKEGGPISRLRATFQHHVKQPADEAGVTTQASLLQELNSTLDQQELNL
jgi:hypothetical protein